MEKTITRRNPTYPPLASNKYPPKLLEIYASRGIRSFDELDRSLKSLISYHALLKVEEAAEYLADCITSQKRLMIVGDFDADGATSTALGVRVLRAMGARKVDFLVPNRFEYGYGLTPEIVEVAAKQSPDVIITVDNGIANHAGVDRAHALGISVVITDHHLPGETLPNAEVIVNPNQPNDPFPSKNLAGVGVIFYCMIALRAALQKRGWFENQKIAVPNLAEYLDIVALGTVADVVPLDHNNRILVYQGLARINQGCCIPGIRALLEVGKREVGRVTSTDLGFAIGPRLNAAGRMDDMAIGIQCLLADDIIEAKKIAKALDDFNIERREVEKTMQTQALENLKSMDATDVAFGHCFYQEDWHQGVIGIVAARLKEKLHRPVIAFAKGDAGEIKGSARSIKGVHIRDVLAVISAKHPQVLSKFGGHAMAAGMTIQERDFEIFTKYFNEEVQAHADPKDLSPTIETDGVLSPDEISLEFAHAVREGGPWGQGFPEPVFDGVFRIVDQRLVGQCHLKLTLSSIETGDMVDAIAFFVDTEQWPNDRCEAVSIVYTLDVSYFRQRERLQLMIQSIDCRP